MKSGFEGATVAYVVIGVAAVVAVAMLAVVGTGEEGIRLVIRSTGRLSALLFAAAFSASAAFSLFRRPGTAWLRRNRRYLGLSFAGSQTIHLAALGALAAVATEFREGVAASTLIVGGVAYVFTFAMAATSSDAAVRFLGRRWRTLHLVGSWWIFAVFALTILPDAPAGLLGATLSALLVATLVLRIAAARTARVRAARP